MSDFFFSFLKLFIYMSNQIWINQSQHQNVHEICNLLMYHIIQKTCSGEFFSRPENHNFLNKDLNFAAQSSFYIF